MKSNLKMWHELTAGGINREGGNSLENFTASFRQGEKPGFNEAVCIDCFFCWVFCPENAIIVEEGKVIGVNDDYCKGCGVCVNECPVKHEDKDRPLFMVKEGV